MELKSRSYSSKDFRPRPIVRKSEDSNFVSCITPWGSKEAAEKVVDDIFQFIESTIADVEVTTPFELLSSLTKEANYLRNSLLLCNESLFRNNNGEFFNETMEALLLLKKGSLLSWAAVGSPNIFIKKLEYPMQSLTSGFDLNFEIGKPQLAPLPGQVLGMDLHANVNAGSISVSGTDRLFLFSGSYFNPEVFVLFERDGSQDDIVQVLSARYPEMPFWIGEVTF